MKLFDEKDIINSSSYFEGQKMRSYITTIFFITLGFLVLIKTFGFILTADERVIFVNSSNFLIKYSVVFMAFDFALTALIVPVLIFKGIFNNDNTYAKAKATFILCSFLFPGIIFMLVAMIYLKASNLLPLIVVGLILYYYINSIIIMINYKHSESDDGDIL